MTGAATEVPHFRMYINGEWVDAEERYDLINPANENLWATSARGNAGHADAAVAAAVAAHERGEWRNASPEDRAATLTRIVEILNERMDDIVELHVAENGVTVRQAMAFHVGYSISHLQYFADLCRQYPFEQSGPSLTYPTLAVGRGSSARCQSCRARGELRAARRGRGLDPRRRALRGRLGGPPRRARGRLPSPPRKGILLHRRAPRDGKGRGRRRSPSAASRPRRRAST